VANFYATNAVVVSKPYRFRLTENCSRCLSKHHSNIFEVINPAIGVVAAKKIWCVALNAKDIVFVKAVGSQSTLWVNFKHIPLKTISANRMYHIQKFNRR
jgi:hypothetical protein